MTPDALAWVGGGALAASLPWVATALLPLLIGGWYLSFSAGRLDRLHHRIETARQALAGALLRRAAAALAAAGRLGEPAGPQVAAAAEVALATSREVSALAAPGLEGPGIDRLAAAENVLTRRLAQALPDGARAAVVRARPGGGQSLEDLAQACTRVQLARRFLNDTVAQTQRVRRKRVVRWTRLAGRAPMPRTVELDDAMPPGLEGLYDW